MIKKQAQKGFTIVELLIATSVFSVVIVGASIAVLQISKMYYKAIIISRTQTTARNVLDNITRPIQLAGGNVIVKDVTPNTKVVCIGSKRITAKINTLAETAPVVWQDTASSPDDCKNSASVNLTTTPENGESLIPPNMRLSEISVNLVSGLANVYKVRVTVFYGERDLMLPDGTGVPTSCKTDSSSSQWCAFSTYETFVYKR